MTPLDQFKAELPKMARAKLEAIKESFKYSVGGGIAKGKMESAIVLDMRKAVENEMRKR
jgi:hypothetical protein